MAKGSKIARSLQKQFPSVAYTTILRLVRERGYDGALAQLQAWAQTPS